MDDAYGPAAASPLGWFHDHAFGTKLLAGRSEVVRFDVAADGVCDAGLDLVPDEGMFGVEEAEDALPPAADPFRYRGHACVGSQKLRFTAAYSPM